MKVDVRLVSATNRNLIADVKQGRFREDLFYRLHVFPITVPPLRERPADIPALARHFLARFAAEEGKRIRLITPEALRVLIAFHWPGNIRQLENAVFRAVVLAETDTIGVTEFPQIAAQIAGQVTASENADQAPAGDDAPVSPVEFLEADLHDADLVPAAFADDLAAPIAAGIPAVPVDALALLDVGGDVRPLEDLEADLIRYAISHYRGQMSEVARRLRIGRSTLYRKLEALGMSGERPDAMTEGVATERQPQKIA